MIHEKGVGGPLGSIHKIHAHADDNLTLLQPERPVTLPAEIVFDDDDISGGQGG